MSARPTSKATSSSGASSSSASSSSASSSSASSSSASSSSASSAGASSSRRSGRSPSSLSIAILGGGPAGLTIARTLADLGFSRVVVFEREATVGGKSCTVDVDGMPHDLGATMGVPIDYRRVVAFAREGGIATTPFPRETHYSLAGRCEVPAGPRRELPRVLAQTARYVAVHRRTWRGELHAADRELYEPWAQFVDRHGLAEASRRMLCYRTGYGYGYDDEVPAVMFANLIRPQTLAGLATGSPFMWHGGTQPIWTGLAARLASRVEIRTSAAITKIVRGDGVTVHTAATRERFDRLVVACDPSTLLPVLDTSAAERRWFTSIRAYPYATFACEIEGLAAGRASIGYVDENMRRDRAGHPMAWVKRYADRDIYIAHLFAPAELPDAEVARRIGEDVARLGGHLVRVRAARRWRFFPHFTSAFMRGGGLAELDAWQGQHHTYLTGEVLSFATLARVVEHASAMAYRIARERLATAATERRVTADRWRRIAMASLHASDAATRTETSPGSET